MMKPCFLRPVSLIVLLIVATSRPLQAAEHEHAHAHTEPAPQAPAKLELNKGKKWATDEALRTSVATLRASFAAQIHAIHTGKLSADQYKQLGATIDTEIARIVANCKLEPQADAVLHILLSDLIAAAAIMQGRNPGVPGDAAHLVVTTLNNYGRYFDHPAWKDLK
jgi:hypothetical protein